MPFFTVVRSVFLLIAIAGFFSLNAFVAHAQMPASLQTEIVASDLFIPTVIDFAPDGRIFVAEKNGTVRIIKNGQALPTPFLTLTDVNTHADRGLIGMALDEDFATNGYVYLSYTFENNPSDPFGPKTSRIVRVTANGDVADMSTYTVLVGSVAGSPSAPSCHDVPITADCIPSDSESHSVGGLRFHDGYLWATTGDGAGFIGVDPNAYLAQDIDSLAGKFLRLNRDGTAPSSNPYFDGDPTSNRSKVYAYGFRNAYRFNVRPSTGDWYVADVGWFDREEVNVIVPGGNYGWPCKEGSMFHPSYNCEPSGPGPVIDPIYEYERDFTLSPNDTIAITGGDFIYTPAYDSSLNDNYIFGDFHRNTISRMVVSPDNVVQSVQQWSADASGPVAFVTGPDGFVYYVSIFTGQVRRIADRTGQTPPEVVADATPLGGAAPLAVTFDASGSFDPDGSALSYLWTFGDGGYSEDAVATHVYTTDGTYLARLSVVDADGNISRRSFAIAVGDQSDSGDADPRLTSLSVTPAEFVVGSIGSIGATVFNNGASGTFNILVNVYDDGTGDLVETETFFATIPTDGSRTVSSTWIPEYAATYRISIGIFSGNWSTMYEWVDTARLITVLNRHPGDDDDVPVGPFDPSVSSVVTEPAMVGVPTTIDGVVANSGATGAVWALTVVTDESGTNAFEDAQLLTVSAGSSATAQSVWTPSAAGTYYVDLGLYSEDWGTMYEWGWRVGTISVGTTDEPGDPTPPDTGEPVAVATTAATAESGSAGSSLPLSATIENTGGAGTVQVLFVISDDSGNVYEESFTESFAAGETRTLTDSWTPVVAGTYYFDVGLFSEDWRTEYEWGWRLGTITVGTSDGSNGGTTEIIEESSSATTVPPTESESETSSPEESAPDEGSDASSESEATSGTPRYTTPSFEYSLDTARQRLQDRINALRAR